VDVAMPRTSAQPPKAEESGARLCERSGPAQVATPTYRDNWELIFGGARAPSNLN